MGNGDLKLKGLFAKERTGHNLLTKTLTKYAGAHNQHQLPHQHLNNRQIFL
jgi:hypothetical protein